MIGSHLAASLIVIALAAGFGSAHAADYTSETLDYPNATNTWARGINDAGQVAGEYWCSPTRGFLATPASEPHAVPALLFLPALVLVAILAGLATSGSRKGPIKRPCGRSGGTSVSR